jgi:hypothetical protein
VTSQPLQRKKRVGWASRLWYSVFLIALRRLRRSSWGSCANRSTVVANVGNLEVTVVVRDTSRPDGYSREELVGMLRLLRRHERLQHWRVPELVETPSPDVVLGGRLEAIDDRQAIVDRLSEIAARRS